MRGLLYLQKIIRLEQSIMLHPAMCIFLAAVVTSVIARVTRTSRLPQDNTQASCISIKVLFCASSDDNWHDTLWHLVRQSHTPRNLRLCVLLECTSATDIGSDLDASLRKIAWVEHAPEKHLTHAQKVRRLVRRFIRGDETLVVVMDRRVRVRCGWDSDIAKLLRTAPPLTVLSSPVPPLPRTSASITPFFPTLRSRSTGATARNSARPFESSPALRCVPSVCWCHEFTVTTSDTLRVWPTAASSSPVANTGTAGTLHVVPSISLLEPDDILAETILDDDEGCDAPCNAHSRVGLTPYADDFERIVKFGSSTFAKLAVDFAKK